MFALNIIERIDLIFHPSTYLHILIFFISMYFIFAEDL